MGRRWQHQVSAEWLLARKDVLTATEIKGLIPEMKRIKKKPLKDGEISPAFAALWSEKRTESLPETESPSSDAARGHIMEPYAIDSWNSEEPDKKLYHWDDCIIKANKVGFSPDAMDIEQISDAVEMKAKDVKPKAIMEIKSYNPAHHIKCILKDKLELDEVWQIAVAFYVLPSLETAYLTFFCPDNPVSMHVFEYSREDLQDKMAVITDVVREYERTELECEKRFSFPQHYSGFTEEFIFQEYIAENYGTLIMK